MGKINTELGPLQRTLLLPLWARAMETQKDQPLLVDSKAVEIVSSLDYDFSSFARGISEISIISWVARCRLYDEIINRFIIINPSGTIVDIGCGMDTYYDRAINSSVQWYELDLPDVIEVRKRYFSETENRKFLACSFLNTEWFDKISSCEKILFISAGVFSYFVEEEIKGFFKAVVSAFPDCEMLFDVNSSFGINAANKIIQKSGLGKDALMKWPLKNAGYILDWDAHFRLLNTYSTYKQKGLKLSFKNRLLGSISDFFKIQYVIHLASAL